ncbi:MAG: InlB B-repeat-containing protein, partial [Tissierellia bacterium]|nr:InlB B-repeat-containing protein [Tissierellia bacterium]
YGASSNWHPGNGGWKYIQENFTENPPSDNITKGKLLYLPNLKKIFTVAPPIIEKDGENIYLNRDGDSWHFTLNQEQTYGTDHFLIMPLHTEGMDIIDSSDDGLNWLNTTAEVTDIEARLLPLSKPSLVDFNGVSHRFSLSTEDYLNTAGYTHIMGISNYYGTMLSNNNYKQAHEKLIDVYNNVVKPSPPIKKEIVESGDSNNNYYTFPIFYKRNRHQLEFKTGDKSIEDKVITDIPYNAYLVGGADYDANPKENEILNYMGTFEKAEFDIDGEIKNKDTVTKNSKGEVFIGWYEDPGFAIPFTPESIQMPDRNLVAYAKWEPIYHTIIVHQHPYGMPGVNDEQNINRIRIEHNKKLDESNPKLEYLIPHGKRNKDFKGWETYGNNSSFTPSEDGKGSPFKYDFDRQVDQKIHLYPKWEDSRARVLYAFNYDNFNSQGERPISEEDYIDMMENHLNIEADHMSEDKYYLSKFEYAMDTPLRLRSPFGYEEKDGLNFVKEPKAKIGTNTEGKKFIGWKIYLRNYETGNWTEVDTNTHYYNSEFEITKNNISYDKAATDGEALGALVFVAQWSDIEKKTQITLHANNGVDPESIKNEKDIIINSDYRIPSLMELEEDGFSKDGYIFAGWTTNRDGSGKKFDDSELIYIDEYFEEQANNLYAQWEKIPEIITETPIQTKRDKDYSIVIESKLPKEAKPLEGTIYSLTDKDGNDILDGDGNKITAIPDRDGNLKFIIPDDYDNPTSILSDKQTVKVKVSQPGVAETLSGESAPLDLIGPVITAGDISEKVGIEIEE